MNQVQTQTSYHGYSLDNGHNKGLKLARTADYKNLEIASLYTTTDEIVQNLNYLKEQINKSENADLIDLFDKFDNTKVSENISLKDQLIYILKYATNPFSKTSSYTDREHLAKEIKLAIKNNEKNSLLGIANAALNKLARRHGSYHQIKNSNQEIIYDLPSYFSKYIPRSNIDPNLAIFKSLKKDLNNLYSINNHLKTALNPHSNQIITKSNLKQPTLQADRKHSRPILKSKPKFNKDEVLNKIKKTLKLYKTLTGNSNLKAQSLLDDLNKLDSLTQTLITSTKNKLKNLTLKSKQSLRNETTKLSLPSAVREYSYNQEDLEEFKNIYVSLVDSLYQNAREDLDLDQYLLDILQSPNNPKHQFILYDDNYKDSFTVVLDNENKNPPKLKFKFKIYEGSDDQKKLVNPTSRYFKEILTKVRKALYQRELQTASYLNNDGNFSKYNIKSNYHDFLKHRNSPEAKRVLDFYHRNRRTLDHSRDISHILAFHKGSLEHFTLNDLLKENGLSKTDLSKLNTSKLIELNKSLKQRLKNINIEHNSYSFLSEKLRQGTQRPSIPYLTDRSSSKDENSLPQSLILYSRSKTSNEPPAFNRNSFQTSIMGSKRRIPTNIDKKLSEYSNETHFKRSSPNLHIDGRDTKLLAKEINNKARAITFQKGLALETLSLALISALNTSHKHNVQSQMCIVNGSNNTPGFRRADITVLDKNKDDSWSRKSFEEIKWGADPNNINEDYKNKKALIAGEYRERKYLPELRVIVLDDAKKDSYDFENFINIKELFEDFNDTKLSDNLNILCDKLMSSAKHADRLKQHSNKNLNTLNLLKNIHAYLNLVTNTCFDLSNHMGDLTGKARVQLFKQEIAKLAKLDHRQTSTYYDRLNNELKVHYETNMRFDLNDDKTEIIMDYLHKLPPKKVSKPILRSKAEKPILKSNQAKTSVKTAKQENLNLAADTEANQTSKTSELIATEQPSANKTSGSAVSSENSKINSTGEVTYKFNKVFGKDDLGTINQISANEDINRRRPLLRLKSDTNFDNISNPNNPDITKIAKSQQQKILAIKQLKQESLNNPEKNFNNLLKIAELVDPYQDNDYSQTKNSDNLEKLYQHLLESIFKFSTNPKTSLKALIKLEALYDNQGKQDIKNDLNKFISLVDEDLKIQYNKIHKGEEHKNHSVLEDEGLDYNAALDKALKPRPYIYETRHEIFVQPALFSYSKIVTPTGGSIRHHNIDTKWLISDLIDDLYQLKLKGLDSKTNELPNKKHTTSTENLLKHLYQTETALELTGVACPPADNNLISKLIKLETLTNTDINKNTDQALKFIHHSIFSYLDREHQQPESFIDKLWLTQLNLKLASSGTVPLSEQQIHKLEKQVTACLTSADEFLSIDRSCVKKLASLLNLELNDIKAKYSKHKS
jgi:hypothetical protein